MSNSTNTTEVKSEKAVKAPAKEKPVITTIKADSRGYAFFKKLTGCPDLSKYDKATIVGSAGTAFREIILGEGEPITNMLKKGYINLEDNIEVEAEIKGNRILLTPVLTEETTEA